MSDFLKSACAAFVLTGLIATAWAGDAESGRRIFDQRCRTCHGGTAKADSPIGPNLSGIVGTRAGTQPSGIHSRAAIDSGVVWDRESLRRFLSVPRREIPESIMPVGVARPDEIDSLLDYLESLR